MNIVNLVGRLTKDIELKNTQNGNSVASFTLAVNRNYKNSQGETDADFIRCIAWRRTAEVLAQYAGKGSQIGVTGRIETRSYDNNQGERVFVTEVIVDQMYLLGSKSDRQSSPQQQAQQYQQYQQQNYAQSNRATGNPFTEHGEQISVQDHDLPF